MLAGSLERTGVVVCDVGDGTEVDATGASETRERVLDKRPSFRLRTSRVKNENVSCLWAMLESMACRTVAGLGVRERACGISAARILKKRLAKVSMGRRAEMLTCHTGITR